MSLLLLFGAAGGSPQNLTQSARFDGSQTFYAHYIVPVADVSPWFPRLTVGKQTWAEIVQDTSYLVQSARFDNSATFYAHSINLTISQAARFDGSQTFYAHTISQGTGLTQDARLDDGDTFYAATVTTGPVTVTQSARLDDGDTFYAATVTTGTVALTQDARLDGTNSFYGHVVTTGPVTLTASRFDNENTFYAHTLAQGTLLVQAERMDDGDSFFAAALTAEELLAGVIGGGDDAPDRGHRGYGLKRSTLKRKREQEFSEQIRDIYRDLTGDPSTAEQAEQIISTAVAPIPSKGESEQARASVMAQRADELRRRADAADSAALAAEIALRMLYRDLLERQDREDMANLTSLLPTLLGLAPVVIEDARAQIVGELWDDDYDHDAIQFLLANVL